MPSRPATHRPAGVKLTQSGRVADYRGSAASRGYDRQWAAFRLSILRERPLCQDCYPRFVTPASEVHHIIKLRENQELRLVGSNVLSLCKPCHSIRTARGE